MTTTGRKLLAKANSQTPTDRMMNWGFWVSVGCSLVLIFAVAVVSAAWAVRHTFMSGQRLSPAQQDGVMAVAAFPGTLRDAVHEVMWQFSDDPSPLLMDRASTVKPYWVKHFPEPSDTGYLLFSGVEANARQSIVELIRISDGKSMARWIPDWNYILSNTKVSTQGTSASIKTLRAFHPLLLPNGDIIFNTGTSLMRMNHCSRRPVWKLDNFSHHSVELDSDGNIISPSKSNLAATNLGDDSIAIITQNGSVISNDSLVTILVDNKLSALPFGIGGRGNINSDLIHINQVKSALTDSKYWKKGDQLISSRNLSTIFLYRPSTKKIIWLKTGPWLNQHSVDFVDNHRISIFNNNVILREPIRFLNAKGHNSVMIYDFQTGEVSEPFNLVLSEVRPSSVTEGRAQILPDGSLFIEDSNNGRMMRLTTDRLGWSFINEYKGDTLGILSWSRYLTQSEARDPLHAIETSRCVNHQ